MNLGALTADALGFGLVLVRMTAMVMTFPGLGGRRVPGVVRILLSLALTLLLFPLLPSLRLEGGLPGVATAVLWELGVGIGLATVASVMAMAAMSAGSEIDLQAGLANASLLDPGGSGSQPLLASFYQALFLLLMFAVDAHLGLLEALARSFQWLPLAAPSTAHFASLGNLLQQTFAGFFKVTLSLILPVMVGLLGLEVVLAFMSRTMPQINMLLVAAPMRIMGGWFLVGVSLPVTLRTMEQIQKATIRLLGG